MRIGIVTIIDRNYGNRLQNYAVQRVLQDYGDVETISFRKTEQQSKRRYYIKYFVSLFTTNISYEWDAFNSKIKFSKLLSTIDDERIKNRYDYLCVGSDQVWNTDWFDTNPNRKNFFLLTFADSKQKISLAPSFGVSQLPEKWKDWFQKYLSDFHGLSAREERGAEMITELTGRPAETLIDPTLMLALAQWRELERKPRKYVNEKYIFTYFLGDVDESQQSIISSVAQKINCGVYALNCGRKAPFDLGPCEFLYLIDHAELVLTDSYHASVFSFIFGRPFLVFNRSGVQTSMKSRIDTFLKTFDLTRKFSKEADLENILECDYSEGRRRLEIEKEKFKLYLDRCFEQN